MNLSVYFVTYAINSRGQTNREWELFDLVASDVEISERGAFGESCR